MTKSVALVVLLSVSMLGCDARTQAAVGAVYHRELADALQRPAVLVEKRAALTFDSGAVAQNCAEYLSLIGRSPIKEDVANQLATSEYLLCDALALIGDKKLAAGPHDVAFGKALADRLDLRSFPSSLGPMLDENKYSLTRLGGAAVTLESTVAAYETRDMHYRLEVVATLDVNNNAKTDWVLWLADEARIGNYRQYQTLVVYDVSDSGALRAVPYIGGTMGQSR